MLKSIIIPSSKIIYSIRLFWLNLLLIESVLLACWKSFIGKIRSAVEWLSNKIERCYIDKQHSCHKSEANTVIVIVVVTLIISSLLSVILNMRVLLSKGTGDTSIWIVIPVKTSKERMKFYLVYVWCTYSNWWIEY